MESASLPTADNKQPKLRWFHPTPSWLLVVLLAIEGLLMLSERWFPKGYAVLIAISSIGMTMLLMLLWFMLALRFRWQFRVSLRSLMVLTVALAIPFSWLAVEMKRAEATVDAIQKVGGTVGYDNGTGPACFRKVLGNHYFADVSQVFLDNTQITDTGLECLRGLAQLQDLALDKTQITDAGLAHLKELAQLQNLALDETQVTDAGLEHLKGLVQLQNLALDKTQVTDAGLEHLKGLAKLQWLSLSNTHVTDVGLAHLKGLTNLNDLFLDNTQVTDKGVKELQQALPDCRIER
jgi:hypothetical protein